MFIFAPIVFVVYASFDPHEIFRFPYSGFSLRWYRDFFSSPMLYFAASNSILIAALAGILSTALGALAAYAVARIDFVAKELFRVIIGAPMVVSKVVLGVALLTLMVKLGIPRGLVSIVLLHTLLCLPFAFVVIWAQLMSTSRAYEEAALTLGADDVNTALEVTMPVLAPALLGSFLLCVTVSFDEFSATQFLVTPGTQTMPIQIYSMIQVGVSPTVNVFATILTVVTVGIPLFAQLALGAIQRVWASPTSTNPAVQ